jgi:hypothetical protein
MCGIFNSNLAYIYACTPASSTSNSASDALPIDEQSVNIEPEPERTPDDDNPVSLTRYQNYIGTWYSDEQKSDSLIISSIGDTSIEFEIGVFRLFGMSATAILVDDEIKFGEGISPNYDGPESSGTIEFREDSILVTIDLSVFGYMDGNVILEFIIKE